MPIPNLEETLGFKHQFRERKNEGKKERKKERKKEKPHRVHTAFKTPPEALVLTCMFMEVAIRLIESGLALPSFSGCGRGESDEYHKYQGPELKRNWNPQIFGVTGRSCPKPPPRNCRVPYRSQREHISLGGLCFAGGGPPHRRVFFWTGRFAPCENTQKIKGYQYVWGPQKEKRILLQYVQVVQVNLKNENNPSSKEPS